MIDPQTEPSVTKWEPGSVRSGLAAFASLFIPGLGQIIQKRFKLGLAIFIITFLSWPLFLGWIFHIWSCLEALRYKSGREFGRKGAIGLGVCLIFIAFIYFTLQNPERVLKFVAAGVMPQPKLLDWHLTQNLLTADEVDATLRNKGAAGKLRLTFIAPNDQIETYETYFDRDETRTIKFNVKEVVAGQCRLSVEAIKD